LRWRSKKCHVLKAVRELRRLARAARNQPIGKAHVPTDVAGRQHFVLLLKKPFLEIADQCANRLSGVVIFSCLLII